MAKYLVAASYTAEGVKGVMKDRGHEASAGGRTGDQERGRQNRSLLFRVWRERCLSHRRCSRQRDRCVRINGDQCQRRSPYEDGSVAHSRGDR
jgi:hypothetical protein